MRRARIYVLLDVDESVRYVGYTVRTLEQRLAGHMRWARRTKSKTHRARWLQSLDVPPVIRLVEEIDEDDVETRERYWIKYYRDLGCDLVNCTDGGRGTLGHKQGPEQIAKRVAKIVGHEVTQTTRDAISLANTGRKRTDETKAKMRARKVGKSWTEAQRLSLEQRYGPKPAPADPKLCEACGSGPFRGVRGLHQHVNNSPTCPRPEAGYGPSSEFVPTPLRQVLKPNKSRSDRGKTKRRQGV